MKKHIIYFFSLLVVSLLMASCNRWDEPELVVPVYDGPAANHTIADIKAKHTSLGSGLQDSICRWDEPFIVKAVVVSSDQGGNCYKYMTIQDETGGIEISIDRTGLYNDYPVGQTIYLDCRGLIVGDYHNKYQIGWKDRTSVQRINQEALGQYIHKDGLPNLNNPLIANPIDIKGTSDLTNEHTNCLVRINNCKFDSKYIGQPLATNDLTLDREVYINGATVVVRTSNYANFRSTIIEDKKYCLYGILSVYNSDYQLTLRTKEDIQDAVNESDILLQALTFDENSTTTGGWITVPSNTWAFQSFDGDSFMWHNSSTTTCDDWLISPELTFSDLQGTVMRLNHRNNVEGSPATYYQVYYSTTYNGGDFDESEWTAFNPNLNSFPGNSFGLSNELNLSVIPSPTFRIALRYHKNGNANGTRWYVKSVNIYKKR